MWTLKKKRVNDNIVLDVFNIFQILRQVKVIKEYRVCTYRPSMQFPKASAAFGRHAILVESHPFCTMIDLQLSFYRCLCYNSRAHCPLLQCVRTKSAILAGAHSYFVVS